MVFKYIILYYFGLDEMNESGLLFVEMCGHHELVIGRFCIPHKTYETMELISDAVAAYCGPTCDDVPL